MENKASVPILFPVDPELFLERLRGIIQEEVKKVALSTTKQSEEEPLLTRKEIASFLKIS